MREKLIPHVKYVVPIASGKGGVGKSTVSVNLALALAKTGAKVGLMDADVYGPSIPTLLKIDSKPVMENNRLHPVERYGIKVISMGFFIPVNDAVIWRGPMLHKMVQDFLGAVEWGSLDYLLIDLPPGTGDIQLSLCQTVQVDGAVIVSTPQEVAWNVAQKAIVMFDKLNAPVAGVIENMSAYNCSHCGHRDEIFGSGMALRDAEMLEIPFLGDIPVQTQIRLASDAGDPVVHSDPGSAAAKSFLAIAERLVAELARVSGRKTKPVPTKFGSPNSSTVDIEWSDGLKTSHKARELRYLCPCASCVNEVTGERQIKLEWVPQTLTASAFYPVGRYALQILWSDGHATGLYGYDFLRSMACAKPSEVH